MDKANRCKLPILLSIIVAIIALCLLLYPTISNIVNTTYSEESIKTYNKNVDTLSKDEIDSYLLAAQQYNDSLAGIGIAPNYEDVLNFGDGVMGTINIPKINVNLPIYHGTFEDDLQKGAIHNYNSSLPIGGESTHAVISAHTALPGKVYFDNLSELEKGDKFSITILNKKMTYEITDINIVKPKETNDYLSIEDGEDLVTLVTCYPYAVNTHRLLVTGKRIDVSTANTLQKSGENSSIEFWLITAVFGVVIATVLLIVFIKISRKRSVPPKGSKNGWIH